MNTLIRLHTESTKGLFDCDFHDDIILKPQSEIALHSLSVERQTKTIQIDSTNDQVTFQVDGVSGPMTALLDHGLINKNNIFKVFRSLTDRMNSALRFNDGAGGNLTKQTGTMMRVEVDKTNKIRLGMLHSVVQTITTVSAPELVTANNINFASNEMKLTNNTNAGSADDLASCLFYKTPYGLGASVARVRCKTLTDANADVSGFVMGLTTNLNALTNNNLQVTDVEFGIRVKKSTAVIEVKSGLLSGFGNNAGGFTLSAFGAGGAFRNNDCLSLELVESIAGEGQKLHLVNHSTANGRRELLKTDIPLRNETDFKAINYYFFIAILGKNDSCILDHAGCTTNPYIKQEQDFDAETEKALGVVPTLPTANGRRTAYNYILPSTVADFMGFDSAVGNPTAIVTPFRIFSANRQFEAVCGSDNYIIEMLNMPLNSYDSLKKGRKDILALVPTSEQIVDDETGVIQYEPKNIIYLPLRNAEAQTLRNIRARILASDYSVITTEGISNLNILIRHPK